MGRCLVRQPDGKFAVWSSYIDNFISRDKTQEEIIEELAQDAYDEERKRLENIFENPESNRSKMAFKDYDECMESIEFYHGGKERQAAEEDETE